MLDYDTVLEIVAENPGVDTEEFRGLATELTDQSDAVVELLEIAKNLESITVGESGVMTPDVEQLVERQARLEEELGRCGRR